MQPEVHIAVCTQCHQHHSAARVEPAKVLVQLGQLVDALQECALIVAPPAPSGAHAGGWWSAHANPAAATMLGRAADSLARHRIEQILPAEAAGALTELCERAVANGKPAERKALAPDPLTDLAGTAVVTVRAVPLGDAVLCTWITDGPAEDQPPRFGHGPTVADRIELSHTLDLLAAQGIGVFTVNLVAGHTVWSAGMYPIFGRAAEEGPITGPEIWAQFTSDAMRTGWRALVRDGRPLDLDIRLVGELGGARVRIEARATSWIDRVPATIHGYCRVVAD